MTQEKDEYLVKKYPLIFRDRYENMKKTAMCWGFEHDDGWFWLLDRLCDAIQDYININNKYRHTDDAMISQVVATQVKEKFGTLRFYYQGGDETIHGMVRLAEQMSANICEECGSKENVGCTQGWYKVLCKKCYDKSEKRNDWLSNIELEEKRKKEPEEE
jgi:hypothetical protein